MRSDKEMFDLILKIAQADERIRAVLMVGSRANPAAPRDKYQDFDIGYYVTDVAPFWDNVVWLEAHFGKTLIVQMPERMTLLPPENNGHFAYLAIFEDGHRIDLSFFDAKNGYTDNGEPAVVLLDKDGLLPPVSNADDRYWHVKPPTEKLYHDCCNEFWWCLNNVAKGIARDELPYAKSMLDLYVRDMLNQMADWHIGVKTSFSVSAGKLGKYYKNHLPPELYAAYRKTYSEADDEKFRAAVHEMCGLFGRLAREVAAAMGYVYKISEEEGMYRYFALVGI